MTDIKWIAVDWGWDHVWVWGMDRQDRPLFQLKSDEGMGQLVRDEFEPALCAMLKDHLPTDGRMVDVVACGIIGRRHGWVEAPYRPVPCKPLDDDFAEVVTERFRVFAVPGLKQSNPADVMCGEETRIAGYLAGDKDFDGVICLPGARSKWVRVSVEEMVSFQTVMTGELFAAVVTQTVLRHSTAKEGVNDGLFLDAVEEGMAHPARLSSRLFSLRAEDVLSGLDAVDVRSRLLGLLVGMELAATKPYWLGQKIALIGEAEQFALYDTALREQGCQPLVVNGVDMVLKGLVSVRQAMEGQG